MPSQINASNSGFGGIVSTGDSSGVLELQTTGTTAVTINTSQNVGIGTTSPTAKLDVRGAGFFITDTNNYVKLLTDSGAMEISRSSGDAYIDLKNADSEDFDCRIQSSGTAGDLRLSSVTSQQFYLGGTERMRLDSSGYLSLNRTSALGNAYINIDYSSTGQNAIIIRNTSTTFNGSFIEFRNSAGNTCGNIIQNGTTTVSYSTSSDYRLKENIAPMTGALDKIAQLKPVTYTWKNTNGEQGEGFIAHELAEVCPLAVSGKKDDVNEDGSIKAQGIDTSFLVATLTAAIQEQQTIINDLKARIETLEAK